MMTMMMTMVTMIMMMVAKSTLSARPKTKRAQDPVNSKNAGQESLRYSTNKEAIVI